MRMNAIRCLFLAVIMFSGSCVKNEDRLTTFILVRHAEKGDDGTDDPDLTGEGEARAMRLAFMLKDTPLQAIYSTNFKRTRDTVKPASEIQNLDVRSYEAFSPDAILKMLHEHRGGTVLISGHSDNIPWTANLLLGKEVFKNYPESQYGVMLIVSVGKTNDLSTVTRLNY